MSIESYVESLVTIFQLRASNRKFYHQGKDALIIRHEPHKLSKVDEGCIADVSEHLEAKGLS